MSASPSAAASTRPATSAEDRAAAMAIREQVFVHEQGVPAEAEADEHDAGAFHVLTREPDGTPVATGRFVVKGDEAKVGRVAVLARARGRGLGRAVMDALEDEARRQGLARVVLHAQMEALPFYQRLGYLAEGPVFLECDIRHRVMHKPLGGHQ